ncbi:hypothetical protein V497_01091 [Pseudogymnoascus sp. VKM F-4516 (FW-969)]|nr:hypothetical protein V497_01091 [Pseudogymnoascus sp. VKM F-4516 (FW-969)]
MVWIASTSCAHSSKHPYKAFYFCDPSDCVRLLISELAQDAAHSEYCLRGGPRTRPSQPRSASRHNSWLAERNGPSRSSNPVDITAHLPQRTTALGRQQDTGAVTSPQQPARRPATRDEQDPEVIRLQLLGNPRMRQEVQRAQPELAAAVENPQRFAQLFRQMQDLERRERMMRQQHIADLNADPFDIDAQTRIAEMIREERVQENLQNAIEHNPEVFGRVHMLYIDVEVNGHKVKAFVDSGAQATIMSPSCAESCGIMRLVDKRFAGIARGVGTANILGRVHSAQIKIGSLFLPCSFTVMEGKDVDLLLGLDMLKRHQACIDLSKDKLVIQDVEVPFLGEADIPRSFEETSEPQVAGPGGTTIGGRSGAISGPAGPAGPAATNAPAAPAAQAAATPQPPLPTQPSQAASVPAPSAESIDQLVALGFSREEAINALNACDGNVEFAAGLLFQG